MKSVLLAAIAAILIGQLCLASFPHTLTWIAVLLLVYFTGFNVLEATQPSLVSKLAPGARKGAAMGVYNTAQALGLFSGGAVGGWLLKHDGSSTVFFGCAALVCIWLVIAATMKKPPARRVQKAAA
jgi:predicted MFS family arabinose efflux permease